MLRHTLRGLAAARLRLLLTAFAIVLGVAFVAGTFVLTDTLGGAIDRSIARSSAGTDVVVRARATVDAGDREDVAPAALARVRAVAGVRAAEGRVEGPATLLGRDGRPVVAPFGSTAGAWGITSGLNPYRITGGRPPRTAGEVALDAATAARQGLRVGQRLRVQLPHGARALTLTGIAALGDGGGVAGQVRLFLGPAHAARLLDRRGFAEVAVEAGPGLAAGPLRDRVAAALPAHLEAVTGAARAGEQSDEAAGVVDIMRAVLLVFAVIALFVGSFIIVNTFSITLAQRTRQLALLRAVGASPRQIVRSVMLEALVVGVLASGVGIAAGVAVAAGLRALLSGVGLDLPEAALVVSARTVVVSALLGVGITLLAALRPALRASRVAPVAALREDAAAPAAPRPGRRRVLAAALFAGGAGLVLAGLFAGLGNPYVLLGAGAAALFLGAAGLLAEVARPLARVVGAPVAWLGTAGRLGRQNAMRNPSRTARTAAALTIGLALVTTATVFAASLKASMRDTLDHRFSAQVVVSAEGFDPFAPAAVGRLEREPAVGTVAAIMTARVREAGGVRDLAAAEPRALERIYDPGMRQGRIAALEEPGTVLVADGVARARGLRLGDRVGITFARTGSRRLRVVGTFSDTTFAEWITSAATYRANVSRPQVIVALATGAGDDDAAAVRAARRALGAFPVLEVQSKRDFVDGQAQMVDQLLALVFSLLALAVIIAVVGIVNTLALSVIERTREIGLLRAVGLSRRQARRMVRAEAVVVSLLGALVGVGLGVFLGVAIVLRVPDTQVLAVPGGTLAACVALAALAGVLAAVLPARRAARMDVLRAIGQE